MKYLLFICGIWFFSCSTNNPGSTENMLQNCSLSILDTVIPFSGFYINERYINYLKENKSPRISQGDDISCITIPERTLQVTRMIWSFHDGGADMVVLKNKDQYQLYHFNKDSISSLAHEIEILSDSKIRIGEVTFIKTNKNFLEALLFKGNYRNETGSIIIFDEEGTVAGFNGFSSYKPVFDYMGPGLDVDQIEFSGGNVKPENFGYQFIGDTLFLYKLNCVEYDSLDNFCGVVEFGEQVLKLQKQK